MLELSFISRQDKGSIKMVEQTNGSQWRDSDRILFSVDQRMCGQRCCIEIKLLIVTTIEFQRFRPLPYTGGTFTEKLKIKN